MRKLKFIVIIYCWTMSVVSQNLIINEFMSSNQNTILDQNGNSPDWIEIYNSSNVFLNLSNFYLSDDPDSLNKWNFPSINLQPHQFLLIYCSGENLSNGELHTNFKIQQSGESIFLSNQSGVIISSTKTIALPTDYSYGCVFDGSEIMSMFKIPTPGYNNDLGHVSEVQCSYPSGFYNDVFELELTSSSKDYSIYYTLDGSLPTTDDLLYTKPIIINPTSNNINLIPTTALEGPHQLDKFIWNTPKHVRKAGIIRYAGFKDSIPHTSVQSRTYFIGDQFNNRYSFPIMSLITDSLNLFDYETGIYVPGERFDQEGFKDAYWPVGNYHNRGEEWERDLNVAFFNKDASLIFETDAGVRVRGGASAAFPQKSLNLYFKSTYGLDIINYPFFEKSSTITYKNLILRNSGNDFQATHFKDALLQDLVKDINLDIQRFSPSIIFINGEYWGIHNIREKYDKYYFKYKYQIPEDHINLINLCGAEVEEGSVDNYFEIENFINNNDVSILENYNYIKQLLDIDNFIDFIITEIYYANYDWPCNNYKLWKTKDLDSKWRFLIYDLDLSFGYNESSNYETLSLEHATSLLNEWPYCPCSNLFFRKLLTNEEFKNLFIRKFSCHLKTTFNSEVILDKIQAYENVFAPEIKEHIDRWGYPESIDEWHNKIDVLQNFAINRPLHIQQNILDFFDLDFFDFTCETNQTQDYQFSTYPNPGPGELLLKVNFPLSKIHRLIVSNIMGEIVYEQSHVNESVVSSSVNLNFLDNGIYILRLYGPNISLHTQTIIIK